MPLGKNAHRVRAQVASLGSTHSRGQRRLGGRQGGVLNVSPAPHLDALDVPSYPTALTGRLHAPAPPARVMVSNRKHTHVYRPKVCPDPIRPAPSTLFHRHPAGGPASQPGSQPVHSPLCRPVETLQPETATGSPWAGSIDFSPRLQGRSAPSPSWGGCDLHHHLAPSAHLGGPPYMVQVAYMLATRGAGLLGGEPTSPTAKRHRETTWEADLARRG